MTLIHTFSVLICICILPFSLAADLVSTTPSPTTAKPQPEKNPYVGYTIQDWILLGTLQDNTKNLTDANGSQESDDVGQNGKDAPTVRKPAINLNKNSTSVLSIHRQGKCQFTKLRIPVKFGINHLTECTMTPENTMTCDMLQTRITELLIGSTNFNFSTVYVSILPKPLDNQTENWVPLMITNAPVLDSDSSASPNSTFGCDAIISSLHIQILFDYFGSINFPQAKITGVLYEFGEMFNTPKFEKQPKAQFAAPKIRISTRVTFAPVHTDFTQKIPQWPSLSLHLPKDFFYPFSHLSSSSSALVAYSPIHVIFAAFSLFFVGAST